MRVIECDECGETLSAANDDELSRRLGEHLSKAHSRQLDEDELAELMADEAYDAMDS